MKTLTYYFTILITVMIWGSSWPISKIIVSEASPLLISFTRNFVATLAFLSVLIIRRNHYDFSKVMKFKKEFLMMGILGIAGYNILFLIGLTFTTSAQGSIIVGIGPAFVALFASVMNKEKLEDTRKYLGILISFIGVLVVIGVSVFLDYQPDYTKGNLLIVLGVIFWALYSICAKRVMKEIEPVVAMGVAAVIGTSILGVAGLITGVFQYSSQSSTFFVGVIWLGLVSSFGATLLYGISIKGLGSTKSSIFVNMVPIFGVIFSYLLIGEKINTSFYIGLVLIVSGISVMNLKLKPYRHRLEHLFLIEHSHI